VRGAPCCHGKLEDTRIGFAKANAALDKRLRNRRFCNDMNTLLRPGLPKFNAATGADIVRTAFLSHLKG